MLDSIVALVDHGNGDRNQFPLRQLEPRFATHQVLVQGQVVLQRFGFKLDTPRMLSTRPSGRRCRR